MAQLLLHPLFRTGSRPAQIKGGGAPRLDEGMTKSLWPSLTHHERGVAIGNQDGRWQVGWSLFLSAVMRLIQACPVSMWRAEFPLPHPDTPASAIVCDVL